jgi:hypothetical protein
LCEKDIYFELWKGMRTGDVVSKRKKPAPNSRAFKSNIIKAYESVVVPFEIAYRFCPIRLDRIDRRPLLHADEPAHDEGEEELAEWEDPPPSAPTVDIVTARNGLQRSLEKMREILPQMVGSHQREEPLQAVNEAQDAVETALTRLENEGSEGWSSVRSSPTITCKQQRDCEHRSLLRRLASLVRM